MPSDDLSLTQPLSLVLKTTMKNLHEKISKHSEETLKSLQSSLIRSSNKHIADISKYLEIYAVSPAQRIEVKKRMEETNSKHHNLIQSSVTSISSTTDATLHNMIDDVSRLYDLSLESQSSLSKHHIRYVKSAFEAQLTTCRAAHRAEIKDTIALDKALLKEQVRELDRSQKAAVDKIRQAMIDDIQRSKDDAASARAEAAQAEARTRKLFEVVAGLQRERQDLIVAKDAMTGEMDRMRRLHRESSEGLEETLEKLEQREIEIKALNRKLTAKEKIIKKLEKLPKVSPNKTAENNEAVQQSSGRTKSPRPDQDAAEFKVVEQGQFDFSALAPAPVPKQHHESASVDSGPSISPTQSVSTSSVATSPMHAQTAVTATSPIHSLEPNTKSTASSPIVSQNFKQAASNALPANSFKNFLPQDDGVWKQQQLIDLQNRKAQLLQEQLALKARQQNMTAAEFEAAQAKLQAEKEKIDGEAAAAARSLQRIHESQQLLAQQMELEAMRNKITAAEFQAAQADLKKQQDDWKAHAENQLRLNLHQPQGSTSFEQPVSPESNAGHYSLSDSSLDMDHMEDDYSEATWNYIPIPHGEIVAPNTIDAVDVTINSHRVRTMSGNSLTSMNELAPHPEISQEDPNTPLRGNMHARPKRADVSETPHSDPKHFGYLGNDGNIHPIGEQIAREQKHDLEAVPDRNQSPSREETQALHEKLNELKGDAVRLTRANEEMRLSMKEKDLLLAEIVVRLKRSKHEKSVIRDKLEKMELIYQNSVILRGMDIEGYNFGSRPNTTSMKGEKMARTLRAGNVRPHTAGETPGRRTGGAKARNMISSNKNTRKVRDRLRREFFK